MFQFCVCNMRAANKLQLSLAAVLALVSPGIGAAQNATGLPTAKEIIDKVVERARWVEQNRPALQYSYTQHLTIEKLDDNNAVKEREERVYQLVLIEGEPYLRLVEKNGKPASPDDLEDERKREKEFRKRLEEQRRRKSKGDDERFRFDQELAGKYRAEVLGREVVNGRPVWVLRFEPKSRDLPVRRRIDRLTNKLAGKLWIDEKDYEVAKAEARLTGPAKFGWGMVANFYKFDLVAEQVRLDDSTWLPLRADALLQGRIVFSSMHQRQLIRWGDFHKNDAVPAPQKSSGPR